MDKISYHRCEDCLSVFALKNIPAWPRAKCACGGDCEFMGFVEKARLVKTEHRCPCDHRCTNAGGPNCDCSCGGANHGTQKLVECTVDLGKAPVAQNAPNYAVCEELGQALGRMDHLLRVKFGDDMSRYERGDQIYSWATKVAIRDAKQDMRRARLYATQKRRMAAFAELEKRYSKEHAHVN